MPEEMIPTFSKHPRSVVRSSCAMVASSQPLAVQTGLNALKAGGTAVDAAIAVNAMLGLVEPMSCGIGGDVFAIVWDAKTQQIVGDDAANAWQSREQRKGFEINV